MTDTYTEISRNSYPARILGGCLGAVVCFFIMIVLFFLFVVLEHIHKERGNATEELKRKLVSISSSEFSGNNNGKTVLLHGELKSPDTVTDPVTGAAFSCLKLERNVEMYQWEEERTTDEDVELGGSSTSTTTWKYNKVWCDEPINSGTFRHKKYRNPSHFPLDSLSFSAKSAEMGVFEVDGSFLENAGTESVQLKQIPGKIVQQYGKRVHLTTGGGLYIGLNPAKPAIGDIRVTYKAAPLGLYSIAGVQNSRKIIPYKAANSVQLALIQKGNAGKAQFIKSEKERQANSSWIMRLSFFIFYWVLFVFILYPFAVISDFIPILGQLNRLTNILLSLALAVIMSLVFIAAGRYFYRPVMKVGMAAGKKVITYIFNDMEDESNSE